MTIETMDPNDVAMPISLNRVREVIQGELAAHTHTGCPVAEQLAQAKEFIGEFLRFIDTAAFVHHADKVTADKLYAREDIRVLVGWED